MLCVCTSENMSVCFWEDRKPTRGLDAPASGPGSGRSLSSSPVPQVILVPTTALNRIITGKEVTNHLVRACGMFRHPEGWWRLLTCGRRGREVSFSLWGPKVFFRGPLSFPAFPGWPVWVQPAGGPGEGLLACCRGAVTLCCPFSQRLRRS